MHKEKLTYIMNDNIYKSIDNITASSKEIITTSTNLISELSTLFESIEDDVTLEILSDAAKLNDYVSLFLNFSKNELQEIKEKSKLAIEKAEKRKNKLVKLKEENNELKEKIKEAEVEKKQLILNIDNISSQLFTMYQENLNIEKKNNLELINKKNEKIIKEKYLKQINNMQKDIDVLKAQNKVNEENFIKFKRKSVLLEEKNKKLNDELGSQTMHYIKKMKDQNELKIVVNSLRLKNDELSKKIKFYNSQVEKWKIKCQKLEEQLDEKLEKLEHIENNNMNNNTIKKKLDFNQTNNNFNKPSEKKIFQLQKENDKENSDSDDMANDFRYKTFSNLNDLLGDDSDYSNNKKENNKIIYSKKKIQKNFKKFSFDLDDIFQINLNTYDNFFC